MDFIAGILTLSEASSSLELTFANPAAFEAETFALSGGAFGTSITLAPGPLPASLGNDRPSLTPVVTFSTLVAGVSQVLLMSHDVSLQRSHIRRFPPYSRPTRAARLADSK